MSVVFVVVFDHHVFVRSVLLSGCPVLCCADCSSALVNGLQVCRLTCSLVEHEAVSSETVCRRSTNVSVTLGVKTKSTLTPTTVSTKTCVSAVSQTKLLLAQLHALRAGVNFTLLGLRLASWTALLTFGTNCAQNDVFVAQWVEFHGRHSPAPVSHVSALLYTPSESDDEKRLSNGAEYI